MNCLDTFTFQARRLVVIYFCLVFRVYSTRFIAILVSAVVRKIDSENERDS